MAQSSNHPQPKSRRVSVAVIVAVLLIALAVVGVFVAPDGSKGGSDAADPAPRERASPVAHGRDVTTRATSRR